MTRRRVRLAACASAVLLLALGTGTSSASSSPEAAQERLAAEMAEIELPAGRTFPAGTTAAELKAAAAEMYDAVMAEVGGAYERATGLPYDVSPEQRQAAIDSIDVAFAAQDAAQDDAQDDAGDDPIEDVLISQLGDGQYEESDAIMGPWVGAAAPSCVGGVKLGKKKLPWTTLNLWVNARLSNVCPEYVSWCALGGHIVAAVAGSFVWGVSNIDPDYPSRTCTVTTSKAYLVSRPCAGGGFGTTAARAGGYYMGPWAAFC